MRILALFLTFISATFATEKPNILFILADDVGHSDLGCYGAKLVKKNLAPEQPEKVKDLAALLAKAREGGRTR